MLVDEIGVEDAAPRVEGGGSSDHYVFSLFVLQH